MLHIQNVFAIYFSISPKHSEYLNESFVETNGPDSVLGKTRICNGSK